MSADYVKVEYPEPVGPVELYGVEIEGQLFDQRRLKQLLEKTELELDVIYETSLQGDEFSVVSYSLLIERADVERECLGDIVNGGFDLSVREGRKYALPEFQQLYKKSFRLALEEINGHAYLLNIYFSVIGFRDKITRKTLVPDPRKREETT